MKGLPETFTLKKGLKKANYKKLLRAPIGKTMVIYIRDEDGRVEIWDELALLKKVYGEDL